MNMIWPFFPFLKPKWPWLLNLSLAVKHQNKFSCNTSDHNFDWKQSTLPSMPNYLPPVRSLLPLKPFLTTSAANKRNTARSTQIKYLAPLSQNCLIKTTEIAFQKLSPSFDYRHLSQLKNTCWKPSEGVIVIFTLNIWEKWRKRRWVCEEVICFFCQIFQNRGDGLNLKSLETACTQTNEIKVQGLVSILMNNPPICKDLLTSRGIFKICISLATLGFFQEHLIFFPLSLLFKRSWLAILKWNYPCLLPLQWNETNFK